MVYFYIFNIQCTHRKLPPTLLLAPCCEVFAFPLLSSKAYFYIKPQHIKDMFRVLMAYLPTGRITAPRSSIFQGILRSSFPPPEQELDKGRYDRSKKTYNRRSLCSQRLSPQRGYHHPPLGLPWQQRRSWVRSSSRRRRRHRVLCLRLQVHARRGVVRVVYFDVSIHGASA